MLIILFASFLATLITPHGLNGALYPFKVFQNYGYTIEENQSIFFLESLGHQKQSVFFFKMAVFLLFLSLFINLKKTKLIDWFLAMVFTTAGALAVRNLPLFSLAVFIPFTYHFNTLASKVYLVLVRNEFPSTLKRSIKLSVIILLIGLLIWQILNVAREKNFGFSQTVGAEKAADFFLRNNLKGPIFNNFDIGSYIAYRLYPKEKVFVDGRPEAYPASFFRQDYIPMQEDIKRFNELDKKYHFNTIFFTHTDQTPWAISFLQQIITNPAWRIIYLDETAIMLVKNIEQNRSVIDQFAMSPTALSPQYDKKSMRSLLQLASFFSKIGDIKNEALIYQQILKLNPNDCLALRNISIITIQQQDPVSLAYITRFQQTCGRKLIQ